MQSRARIVRDGRLVHKDAKVRRRLGDRRRRVVRRPRPRFTRRRVLPPRHATPRAGIGRVARRGTRGARPPRGGPR